MQVANFTEDIILEVEDKVVSEALSRRLLDLVISLVGENARMLHLVYVEVGNQFLIPAHKVDIAI